MKREFRVGDMVRVARLPEGNTFDDGETRITDVMRQLIHVGDVYEIENIFTNNGNIKIKGYAVPTNYLELVDSLPEKWCVFIKDRNNVPEKYKSPVYPKDYYAYSDPINNATHNYVTGLRKLPNYTEITEEQFKQIIEKELNKKEMNTYKVTRENLEQIYLIACDQWKERIVKLTQETLGAFGTEGELSEETVQSMRDAATKEQRPVIDKLFPKPEIKVVGYISACEVLNIKPLKITDFKHLPEFERVHSFVRHMLVVVRKALVGDWEPDYTNHSQDKYEVYGKHSDTDGFGFTCNGRGYGSVVGSDLTFPSKDLAEYSYEIMEKEYLTYLMNQPYDI